MTFRSAALVALACFSGPAAIAAAPAALETRTLTISGQHRPLRFTVEVARTPEQQARGLMFRRAMPQNRGMIFPMKPPRMASFWMKNTYLPLDMIFIRADGTIASIAPMVKPLSEEITGSFEPVAAVLELNGGVAAKLGIKPGDKVSW